MKSRPLLVSAAATLVLAAGACQAHCPNPGRSPDQAHRPNPGRSPDQACGDDSSSQQEGPSPADSDDGQCGEGVSREELLAPARGLAKQGAPGWEYGARLRADVDGDGAEETLWVIAQAELVKGRPAWDDGQEWQVYVEEDSGETTHVFARYVQLARLEVALTMEAPHELLLNASGPSTAAIYRLRYLGPGEFSGRRIVQEGYIAHPEPVLPDTSVKTGR